MPTTGQVLQNWATLTSIRNIWKLKVSNLTSSLKSENPFSFALDYASFKLRKIRMTNSQRYREGGEISYTRRRIYMLSKCCIRGVFKTDFWRYLGFCPNQGASYSGGERRCYRYGTTTTTNERTVKIELLSQLKLEAEFCNFPSMPLDHTRVLSCLWHMYEWIVW